MTPMSLKSTPTLSVFVAQKVEESPGEIQASSADSMVNFIEDMGSLRAAAAP